MFSNGNFKTGMESLRGAKWRNFWTMLGIIIGVSSVITVVGIGEGIKNQISGQIKHQGKDLIIIKPGEINGSKGNGNFAALTGNSINGSLTPADLKTITENKDVSLTAPLSATTGELKAELGTYKDGLIVGTTADFPNLINQSMEYGAFLSPDDMDLNTAVLGQNAADKMFESGIPLGRTFKFHGEEFIVRGIFSEFNNAPLSEVAGYNDAVFIPYDILQKLTNKTAPTYQVLAKPSDVSKIDRTVKQLKTAIAKNHGGANDIAVIRQDQNLSDSNSILALLTKLITGVAAISLLVGGIGIMNVMLVSVTERLKEIGIRKAIGGTNRQILGQFLAEATILSLSGGVIGVALAYAIAGLLRIFTNLQPSIPWEIVLIATGVSLLIGVIFGTIPALKAARKDPIEALRSQ